MLHVNLPPAPEPINVAEPSTVREWPPKVDLYVLPEPVREWPPKIEFMDLPELVKKVRDLEGSILEVGCWEGNSTVSLANNCFPETLICNDTWLTTFRGNDVFGTVHVSEETLKGKDIYTAFVDTMNIKTQQNYIIYRQDWLEWLTQFEGSIKFIHINAYHDYKSVFQTLKLVIPKMVKGGIICGDDYLISKLIDMDGGGIQRAVLELLPNHKDFGNLWYFINE